MQRPLMLSGLAIVALCLTLVLLRPDIPAVGADGEKDSDLNSIRGDIQGSGLPNDVKSAASSSSYTYGTVYYVWPMENGPFLFGIERNGAGHAFSFVADDAAAEAMIGVLMQAFESQKEVYVFADSSQPQLATSVVRIR